MGCLEELSLYRFMLATVSAGTKSSYCHQLLTGIPLNFDPSGESAISESENLNYAEIKPLIPHFVCTDIQYDHLVSLFSECEKIHQFLMENQENECFKGPLNLKLLFENYLTKLQNAVDKLELVAVTELFEHLDSQLDVLFLSLNEYIPFYLAQAIEEEYRAMQLTGGSQIYWGLTKASLSFIPVHASKLIEFKELSATQCSNINQLLVQYGQIGPVGKSFVVPYLFEYDQISILNSEPCGQTRILQHFLFKEHSSDSVCLDTLDKKLYSQIFGKYYRTVVSNSNVVNLFDKSKRINASGRYYFIGVVTYEDWRLQSVEDNEAADVLIQSPVSEYSQKYAMYPREEFYTQTINQSVKYCDLTSCQFLFKQYLLVSTCPITEYLAVAANQSKITTFYDSACACIVQLIEVTKSSSTEILKVKLSAFFDYYGQLQKNSSVLGVWHLLAKVVKDITDENRAGTLQFLVSNITSLGEMATYVNNKFKTEQLSLNNSHLFHTSLGLELENCLAVDNFDSIKKLEVKVPFNVSALSSILILFQHAFIQDETVEMLEQTLSDILADYCIDPSEIKVVIKNNQTSNSVHIQYYEIDNLRNESLILETIIDKQVIAPYIAESDFMQILNNGLSHLNVSKIILTPDSQQCIDHAEAYLKQLQTEELNKKVIKLDVLRKK